VQGSHSAGDAERIPESILRHVGSAPVTLETGVGKLAEGTG
jgi:hypothetical protein